MGLLLLAVSAISCKAIEHLVGGNSLGWSIPADGNASYASWVSSHNFAVDDTLVFKFKTRGGDVALVSKRDFEDCNDNDPLWYGTIGPAYFSIKSPGDYYFISTVAKHCVAGQKLSIQVIHNGNNNNNNNSTSLASTGTVNAAANIPASSQPSLSPTKCSSYFLTTFSLIFTSSIVIAFVPHF